MSLLDKKLTRLPMHYPKAHEYFQKQSYSHWNWNDISLVADITDWKQHLTETERQVIGQILKGFVTTEVIVNDYWINKIARRFKHPEIQQMSVCFGAMEAIHIEAYSKLNESLGMEDYEQFLLDPTTKAKLDNVLDRPEKTKRDIALSLAVFSAFTEGVNLFSSFAILLNFSRFNKMKNMGQIISLSIRDESLHSEAGCWLFRTFIQENPGLLTDELKEEIYEAARASVKLEDEFLDKAFELGPIEGIEVGDVKQFIRFRANNKLVELGLAANWRKVDKEAVARITSWFDILSAGATSVDFFAMASVDYSVGVIDFGKVFDDEQ
jgi:ribonucleoside-diphosphate reductase beta chain